MVGLLLRCSDPVGAADSIGYQLELAHLKSLQATRRLFKTQITVIIFESHYKRLRGLCIADSPQCSGSD